MYQLLHVGRCLLHKPQQSPHQSDHLSGTRAESGCAFRTPCTEHNHSPIRQCPSIVGQFWAGPQPVYVETDPLAMLIRPSSGLLSLATDATFGKWSQQARRSYVRAARIATKSRLYHCFRAPIRALTGSSEHRCAATPPEQSPTRPACTEQAPFTPTDHHE